MEGSTRSSMEWFGVLNTMVPRRLLMLKAVLSGANVIAGVDVNEVGDDNMEMGWFSKNLEKLLLSFY